MVFYFLLLCLLFNLAQANCGDMKLPFDDRIKRSALIFTGVAISDAFVAKPSAKYDRVVEVEVKEKFKGDLAPGLKIKLYYKMSTLRSECDEFTQEIFAPYVKSKSVQLFYATSVDSIYFNSHALGCGNILNKECKVELKKLKLKF